MQRVVITDAARIRLAHGRHCGCCHNLVPYNFDVQLQSKHHRTITQVTPIFIFIIVSASPSTSPATTPSAAAARYFDDVIVFLRTHRFLFLRLFHMGSYSFFLLVLEPVLSHQRNGPKEKGTQIPQTQKQKPTHTDFVGEARGWRRKAVNRLASPSREPPLLSRKRSLRYRPRAGTSG